MFFKTCFTSPLKGNRETAYHHTILYNPLFHCLQFPHLATATPNGQPHSLQPLLLSAFMIYWSGFCVMDNIIYCGLAQK